MHLETAREWFKYLTDQFKMKTSDVAQQEATCDPRTAVGTHQKRSKHTRKPRKHEATANKLESSAVDETCNAKCHKQEREARDQRGVEKRVRRGRKATERTSEGGAAMREPGEEATDKTTRSISLAVMPSSQDNDSRDMGAPCTQVTPREPQSTSPVASEVATDAAYPNMTSARPAEPAGMSHELQDEPHKSMGSYPGKPVDALCKPQDELQDAPRGIAGDNASPEVWQVNETIARGSCEPPHELADDISLASPASSQDKPASGVVTPMDNTTDASVSETATPPSILLEGEHDAHQCTNSTCTGQLHGANVHSEGPSAWAEHHTSCTTNGGP
ncbi:hypothetical protein BU15DRAFT_64256 [Melanogaster broomeanus]|nr:hypothetical protein BU15DRAFT_64256 [Melanogaster broomeanus]